MEDLKCSELPEEKEHIPPQDIIMHFELIEAQKIIDENKERKLKDYFNDQNQKIVRETYNASVKVKCNEDMIDKFNDYEYSDKPNAVGGCFWTIVTCGVYYFGKRTTIPDGNFGHFTSSGRHMLARAGITALLPTLNSWVGWNSLIPCDMEKPGGGVDCIKKLGSKTILTVQENHLGGAFRVKESAENADAHDGEYVLFTQGRYVLRETDYRKITVESLTVKQNSMVKLGPITVCYIKEGFLGGAFRIYTGEYEIFHPGPPYLLHEKEYENIDVIRREGSVYRLGPVTFVKVRDGELAGAWNKENGRYEILPAGHTYKLFSKDYKFDKLRKRSEKFRLGPFIFLTVKKYMLAGVYQKKGGRFILLPPGRTYQLSKEHYEDPIMIKNDKHRVIIGPLTYLTLEAGTLSGAYRIEDGKFVEFTDRSKEHLLHETEYHSLVVIPQFEFFPQNFGPSKIITIPEGFYGVFLKEGVTEIKEPGFYRLSSDYHILENIPKNMRTDLMENIEFKSKDGVRMACASQITWQVDNPKYVSLYPGGFKRLMFDIKARFQLFVQKLAMRYNRNRLLPTKQDVLILARRLVSEGIKDEVNEEGVDAMLTDDLQRTQGLHKLVEDEVKKMLDQATENCQWGVKVYDVNIINFILLDNKINKSLTEITEIMLEKDLVRVEGKLALTKAEATRNANMKRTEATCLIDVENAKVNSNVRLTKEEAIAQEKHLLEIAKSEAEITKAKVESEAEVLRATTKAVADSKQKEIILEIQNAHIRQKASAEAEAIKTIAEANYQKKIRENKAAGLMTDKQFQLELLKTSVSAMEMMGKSAWRMPDKYMKFYNEFAPLVKLPTN